MLNWAPHFKQSSKILNKIKNPNHWNDNSLKRKDKTANAHYTETPAPWNLDPIQSIQCPLSSMIIISAETATTQKKNQKKNKYNETERPTKKKNETHAGSLNWGREKWQWGLLGSSNLCWKRKRRRFCSLKSAKESPEKGWRKSYGGRRGFT